MHHATTNGQPPKQPVQTWGRMSEFGKQTMNKPSFTRRDLLGAVVIAALLAVIVWGYFRDAKMRKVVTMKRAVMQEAIDMANFAKDQHDVERLTQALVVLACDDEPDSAWLRNFRISFKREFGKAKP